MVKTRGAQWETADWELAQAANGVRLVSQIMEGEQRSWPRGASELSEEEYAMQPWFIPAATHAMEHVGGLTREAAEAQGRLPSEQRSEMIEGRLHDAWSMCEALQRARAELESRDDRKEAVDILGSELRAMVRVSEVAE